MPMTAEPEFGQLRAYHWTYAAIVVTGLVLGLVIWSFQ